MIEVILFTVELIIFITLEILIFVIRRMTIRRIDVS